MKTTRKRVAIFSKKSEIYYHSKMCCPAFNSFSSATHSFSSAIHSFWVQLTLFWVQLTLFWVKMVSCTRKRVNCTRKRVKRRTTHFRVVVNFTLFWENCHSFSSGFHYFLNGFTLFWVVFHSFSSESQFTRKRVILFTRLHLESIASKLHTKIVLFRGFHTEFFSPYNLEWFN